MTNQGTGLLRRVAGGRLRRVALTSMGLLMAAAGITALSPNPAQAGYALQDGKLTAAVYDRSPFPLHYVGGWSQYGFAQAPVTAAAETGGSLFVLQGSAVSVGGWPCYYFQNSYNAWFTYRVIEPHSGGAVEYITMSIHGTRKHSSNGGCTTDNDLNPAVEVWQTSTAPPTTWRYTDGPPPNLIPSPRFIATKDRPEPFDLWVEEREGPGVGKPAVVSLGDSTISGEAGRWAGNTNGANSVPVDAGTQWYWDTPGGEAITDCHRSKSALVHIGGGYNTHNFACSAAMTYTYEWPYPQGRRFKPGVDLYCNGGSGTLNCPGGEMGQLNELYHYARNHNRWLATGYIEFFRGLPALVVIFFMAFAVPLAFHWIPPGGLVGAGIVGLVIVYSAYMAETLRAGIQAVPKGQREAAESLGMSGLWTTISVILPQAIRIVIPPLTNELVALIKDTSLLFVVGMQADQVELSAFGQNNTVTYANASPLLAIALFYLLVTLPMTRLVAWLERRQQRAR